MKISDFSSNDNVKNLKEYFQKEKKKNSSKKSEDSGLLSDSTSISNTSKVMGKVDSILNLSGSDRLAIDDLSPEEKEEFLAIIGELLQEGIVGYEVLEGDDGGPEKHFIVNRIGDRRNYGRDRYYDADGRYR